MRKAINSSILTGLLIAPEGIEISVETVVIQHLAALLIAPEGIEI